MINAMGSFVVDQNLRMPLEHAPVTVSFKIDFAKFRGDSQLLLSMIGSYLIPRIVVPKVIARNLFCSVP